MNTENINAKCVIEKTITKVAWTFPNLVHRLRCVGIFICILASLTSAWVLLYIFYVKGGLSFLPSDMLTWLRNYIPVPGTYTEKFTVAIGVIITIYVAYTQDEQISSLAAINDITKQAATETRELTKKLEMQSIVKERSREFFGITPNGSVIYDCIFPVEYNDKPLPLVSAGDYEAIKALSRFLGSKCIKYHPIGPKGNQRSSSNSWRNNSTHIIYLCSPKSNDELSSVAAYGSTVDYYNKMREAKDNSQKIKEVRNEFLSLKLKHDSEDSRVQLPCWFATQPGSFGSSSEQKIILIATADTKTVLTSPSEDDYSLAAAEKEKYIPCSNIFSDYALLLRLSSPLHTTKCFVIAGIHQYGTWIASDFLRRLLRKGEYEDYRKVFLSNMDFAAIILGKFKSDTYEVDESDITIQYVWQRNQTDHAYQTSEWTRFIPSKKADIRRDD